MSEPWISDQNYLETDPSKIITNYKSECELLRKGANFDLEKCFKDGKPIIISGSHVLPELY